MSVINSLIAKRPWIAYIDDERELDNGIIVTLTDGWDFADEPGCGVRGFDTMSEVRAGTLKSCVQQATVAA